jgi:hypothetical protein
MHGPTTWFRPPGPVAHLPDALSLGAAIGAALMIAATAGPARAQGVVVVQPPTVTIAPPSAEIVAPFAPPAVRMEVVPPAPDDTVLWRPGHWIWANGTWAWEAGHYVARPQRTAMWEPGHWVARPEGGYVWFEGHWN